MKSTRSAVVSLEVEYDDPREAHEAVLCAVTDARPLPLPARPSPVTLSPRRVRAVVRPLPGNQNTTASSAATVLVQTRQTGTRLLKWEKCQI